MEDIKIRGKVYSDLFTNLSAGWFASMFLVLKNPVLLRASFFGFYNIFTVGN